MQGYLSEMTARWLLLELARTTLLVAVLGAAAWLVLRLERISSPALHRVCCVMVLLAGWTLVRWPVDVAWYEAPPAVVADIAEAEPGPKGFTPPIDPKLLSPPPEFGAGMGAPAVMEPEVAEPVIDAQPEKPRRPERRGATKARRSWNIARKQVAVGVWLFGIVAIAAVWLVGYLRFLWQLPRGLEGEPELQAEFATAMAEQGRAGDVEFRVTEDMGPLLCRLPRRTVLLVPRVMWSELDAVERRAILRHELAHLSRGDLWKSLAVRVLALPHWFNPVAWLAVRRFDDAAEWVCDRAAMDQQPTKYAAMLLRLGELAGSRARFGSAMSNRPLTTRIRRLLTIAGTEDSAMKKACLVSLLLLVVPLALVRVNLVAEEPTQEPTRDQAELAEETPKPANDLGDGFLGFPTEEQMKAAAGEKVPSAEPPRDEEPETPVKVAQRKMVEFAKKSYEANDAAYKAGAITLDQVFHWSSLWLSAELAMAESREEQIAAAQRNLARLKVVEANIRRLFEQQARGGEHNAMYAANFYVADAERRLAEIEAMPEPRAEAERPAGNRELVNAAKQAFEATNAAYAAGTETLETVIAWSIRWLTAELEIARSRDEQLSAAAAHLQRISGLYDWVEALYRTGSKGGEAKVMATAKYYLADAERRVKEIEGMPEQTATSSGQRAPATLNTEQHEQLAAPGGTQSDTPRARRSPPLTPYPEPAAGVGLQEPKVVRRLGGKYYELNDPALPSALKTALREGTREEMIQAMADVCIRLPRTDGSTIEIRFTQLAPELIALLGHQDSKICDRAENALLSIRSSIEAELQEAAKSDNAEIATRAQRLLKKSEPEPPRQPSGYFKLLSVQPQSQLPAAASQQPSVKQYTQGTPPQAGELEPPALTPKFVDPYAPQFRRNANSTPSLAPAASEAGRPPARTLRRSREFREGMPTLAEERPLYYDGKTLDQWRTQLQTDLSPVLRKEAMYAMAEFAAHGYGKEAAEVIFDAMRDYSVWTIDNSPEGQLKQAALIAAKRVATADRLPAIVEAITSGNRNERLFALQIIPEDATKAEIIPLLVAALDDMDSAVVGMARMQLAKVDHDNPQLIASLANGLASNDPQVVQNAVQIVRGGNSRPYPTLLPKALALIDNDSPDIRDVAIRTLTALSTGPEQPAYVEALEEIETGGGPQALNAVKVLDGKIGEQRLLQRMPPIDRRR